MMGKVYLVGAGPGDPELITRRGYRLLTQADLVVHDRLIPEELLTAAPPAAEIVAVGKCKGRHPVPQEEIQRILVAGALAGKRVVRLKGGDPFVFGRGGEEALYLRQRGIPFEVVPGVSSAIAGPACAGIPVTMRGTSGSFLVLGGHTASGEEDPNTWRAAATVDTVVLLMGLDRLEQHVERLLSAGRAPHTPAAAISRATTRQQQVVTAPLADLAAAVRCADLVSPTLIVIGDVVAMHDALAWQETPLWSLQTP